MRILPVLLVAALLGFQNTYPSIEQKITSPYRSQSSAHIIKHKDSWTYVTENRSFRFDEVLGDTGEYQALLLLEETYHNERTPGIEGVKGNVTVSAWTLKNGEQRKLRWKLQARANEGDVRDRF
jgi:hypothetical protein